MSARHQIETKFKGRPVVVEYSASQPVKGNRRGHPDSWTPGEGPEIEIRDIFYADGKQEGIINPKEYKQVEEAVRESIEIEVASWGPE